MESPVDATEDLSERATPSAARMWPQRRHPTRLPVCPGPGPNPRRPQLPVKLRLLASQAHHGSQASQPIQKYLLPALTCHRLPVTQVPLKHLVHHSSLHRTHRSHHKSTRSHRATRTISCTVSTANVLDDGRVRLPLL